jgi:hypothetical protein
MGADLPTQPYEIRSFKGGLTDEPDGGNKNQYTRADNLLLAKNEQPFSRPGSVLYDSTHPQLPGGLNRVNRLINYAKDTALIALQNNRAYRYTAGNWSEIQGPGATAAFVSPVIAASRFQTAEWQRQLMVVNDAGAAPVIMYPDQGGTWKARTMGLPALPNNPNYVVATQLANAITLANDIRTHFNSHIAGASAHQAADTVAQGIMSGVAAATDLSTLLTLANALMRAFTAHVLDAHGGAPVYHYYQQPFYIPRPQAIWDLASTSVPTTLVAAAAMLNDIRLKFNQHDQDYNITAGYSFHRANDSQQVTASALSTLTSGPTISHNTTLLINAANQINTQLSAHINEYGALPNLHKVVPQNGDQPTAYVATDWNSLVTLVNLMVMIYTWHEWDAHYNVFGGTAPLRHRAIANQTNVLSGIGSRADTTGNYATGSLMPVFPDALDPNTATQADVARILADIQSKYNSHDQDSVAHGTISGSNHISQLQMSIVFPDYANYTYALHYDYVFQVGNTTYEVAGPVFVIESVDNPDPAISPTTISNIPALTNATGTNYDLASVKIKIYRTYANQQVPNLIDIIANGTTTYVDRASDNSIAPNAIYTTGGIPNSDPPPAAKFICQIRDTTFYANYTDSLGNSFPNRILQSSPGASENCPGNFYEKLPQDCTGIAAARELLIAWTASATYRIDGRFGIDGAGSMTAVPISSTVGLSAGYSPVSFDDGVIFWGSDGIYFTDGYKVHRLTRYWTPTYLELAPLNLNTHGAFDDTGRRIWWTLQTAPDDTGTPTDVNAALVLDLNHDPTNTENAVFTTASNLSHFAPSSLAFFGKQLIRGDTRGYVFKHDPSYLTDPKVNTGTTPSTWSTMPIIYDWISVAFDFDTAKHRKWIPLITAEFKNLGTNVSVQINSNNDDGRQFAALFPIRWRQAMLRGLDATTQGQATAKLAFGNYNPENKRGLIKEKRHFPAKHLRCHRKQVQFTNAYCIVADSDSLGTVSISLGGGGIPTATLSTGNWPTDMVDQVFFFPQDGYTQGYTVTAQSGATVTLTNPGLTCPTGANLKWQAKGFPKDEKFRMVNYAISYAILGEQHPDGQEGTGANKT